MEAINKNDNPKDFKKSKPLLLNRRERKKYYRSLLEKNDIEDLLYGYFDKNIELALISLLFDSDEIIKERALIVIGKLAAIRARENTEAIRETVRKMIWAANDESGNSAWMAPEVVGEVLGNVPKLINEFFHMLFMMRKVHPYKRGVYRAVCRISEHNPEVIREYKNEIIKDLENSDLYVKFYAIHILDNLGASGDLEILRKLKRDDSQIKIYDTKTGLFISTTISKIIDKLST